MVAFNTFVKGCSFTGTWFCVVFPKETKNISTPSCFGWIFVFKKSWRTYRAKRRDAWRRNVFPSNSSIEFPLATVKPPWYLFSPPVAVGTAFKFTVFHFIHFGDFLIVKKRKLFAQFYSSTIFFLLESSTTYPDPLTKINQSAILIVKL